MAYEMERLLIGGAQSVLLRDGYNVQLVQTSPERSGMLPNGLEPAGVINIGGIADRDLLARLLDEGVPLVVAGSHVNPLAANCVTIDFHHSMLEVVQHLVDRGRRRIALVNGPDTTTTSRERYLGLRLALALHSLPFESEQLISGNFTFASGDETTRRLLQHCPSVDAIIYGDDDMAVGGLRALRSLGRHVPDEISVVGYYDYEIAQFTEPSLTSVSFDKHAMGAIAARRLCELLTHQSQPVQTIVMPSTLTVRASS
jgi:DNA-binding LacI/PurR family transcriptional regulator